MFTYDMLLNSKHRNISIFNQTFLPSNKIITFVILYLSFLTQATDITDNTCTFKVKGKVFSLTYLNMKSNTVGYYTVKVNDTAKIQFNFCEPFVPQECKLANITSAYSYLITQNIVNTSVVTTCTSFSSNSKTSNFNPLYLNTNEQKKLNLTLTTQSDNITTQKSTIFILDCKQDSEQKLQNVKARQSTDYGLVITGKSPYACPLFQISNLWSALSDNLLIFGVIMFVIGFIMLFYGILMTHLMIFLAAYFLSFAAMMGIFTTFLGPESSRIVIYFSLLFILFISTLIAYALTRLVEVSIFFIGAFLGFLLAAIVNTIFIKMFSVYSIWSMIFFSIVFMIPLGLLTFKFSQQIIVISTSLAGAYMVVRPLSWIFGGFPNQFTLYQSIQSGEISTIPWTIFIYLILILGIFVLGVLYQLLKISKRDNDLQHINYLPDGMQDRLDLIHHHVQKLINKYANTENQKNQDYVKMIEGSVGRKSIQLRQPEKVIESFSPEVVKERKSKQNDF